MAFATNSSAFGIKPSISTGVFGAQASQQPNSNPSPFASFGASTSQPSTQPTSFGSFGQNQNPTQNQPATGGLFGQLPQPPQQSQPTQQPSGSLFGGGTWGSGSTNTINTNTSTQPTQSGFTGWGLGNNNQQQQQQQQQQQPQQQQTTGFGTGGSIFGNTTNQTQQQPQSGGLWGSTVTSSAGQSLFAQPTSAPSAPQSQVPSFTRTTKFNDLPEQIQKLFENVDSHIQGRIQISNDLKARSLGEEPTKGAELIHKVHNDLVITLNTLQADKALAEELKSKVDQSVQDTIITTRIINGFRNPQQNGAHLKNHANFPLEFFTRAAGEVRQKLQWYKGTIEQIERRLASAQNQIQYSPQAITATLQAQNTAFMTLAGRAAELDAELQKVKSAYRELWRAHTGSARDPFNETDRRPGDGGGLSNGFGSLDLNR